MDNVNEIDENIYYDLVLKYGKDYVSKYLDSIIDNYIGDRELSYELSLDIWDKFGYYLAISEHSIYEKRFLDSFNFNDSDYVGVNNKYGRKMLSLVEEKIYGIHLLSRKYIKILKDDDIDIDLNMVFGSINSLECRDYILGKFDELYSVCNRNSKVDNEIKKYLSNYKDNCVGNNIPDIKSNVVLSEEELCDNIDMYVRYSIARDNFIVHNVDLVGDITKRCYGKTMETEDLYMEGIIGLISALKKYDVRMRNKFATYATYDIRRYITRSIADKDSCIRIPVYLFELNKKINRVYNSLYNINGRKPTDLEIADYINISEDMVKEVKGYFYRLNCDSLDREVVLGENYYLDNFIKDDSYSFEEDILFDESFKVFLEKINNRLNERERRILIDRFFNGRTLKVISEELGCTLENVRQIENKALKKVRQSKYISEFNLLNS